MTLPALPVDFLGRPDRPAGWGGWLDRLPRLLRDLVEEWELVADGDFRSGATAVAMPVRRADGTAAVLKVGWPHPETEHEHLALQAWGGGPAVRLLRADPRRFALLLERADADHDLSTLPVLDACTVIGELYARLHRPALPQLRTLSSLTTEWIAVLAGIEHSTAVPRRLVTEALSYARGFVTDPLTDGRLLHTDLHYTNVLRADALPAKGPQADRWLAIDPQPVSGDPCFEVAPLLWNRWDEVEASPRARDAVVDRFYAVVDVAGLDESRTRAWVVVRELVELARELTRPRPDQAWISVCTTIVKALPT